MANRAPLTLADAHLPSWNRDRVTTSAASPMTASLDKPANTADRTAHHGLD